MQTAKENMHSGFSGTYPQPYPIMNKLLMRVLNFDTQQLLEAFQPTIPTHCIHDTHAVARKFPSCADPRFLEETQRLTRAYEAATDDQEKL